MPGCIQGGIPTREGGLRTVQHGSREAYALFNTEVGRLVHLPTVVGRLVHLPTVVGRHIPGYITRFTVGGIYPGVMPEPLSEVKPGNLQKPEKTLEWSTIIDFPVILTVLVIPGYSWFPDIPGFLPASNNHF